MRHSKSKYKFSKILMYLILISLTTSPAFAFGAGGINLMLVGVICLSPVAILLYPKSYSIELYLIAFCASVISFPLLLHPETMRWTTVLYSVFLCLNFIAYNRMLNHNILAPIMYTNLLKKVVFAFTIVLLIQQYCVLTGLPVFNKGIVYEESRWKLNALTSEPSHSVRFLAVMMYSYIEIIQRIRKRKYSLKVDAKEDKWLWVAFMWSMLTCVSATAYLFLVMVFSRFLTLKKTIAIAIIGIVLSVVGFSLSYENEQFQRSYDVAMATLTLDERAIIQADHSGSIRIVPMIIAAKMIDLTTLDGWFGKGVDYLSTVMSSLFPNVQDDFTGGGVFMTAVEYGFIAFLLFFIFSLRATIRRDDFLTFLFWLLMCTNEGVNMQLTWVAIILLYTNRFMIGRFSSAGKIK